MLARWWPRLARVLGVIALGQLAVVGAAWLRVALDDDAPSRSHGSLTNGRVVDAHPIPPWGEGYTTYSMLGSALGRQYVHGAVRDALLGALAQASHALGGRRFVVAETGWPEGGSFAPHRSHARGTSVDVLVPLRDARDGAPRELLRSPLSLWGYGVELDARGRSGALELDAEALATLLCALEEQRGARPSRVILAPELRAPVERAARCRASLSRLWMRERPWVRHDDHVHVDFAVRTQPVSSRGARERGAR